MSAQNVTIEFPYFASSAVYRIDFVALQTFRMCIKSNNCS